MLPRSAKVCYIVDFCTAAFVSTLPKRSKHTEIGFSVSVPSNKIRGFSEYEKNAKKIVLPTRIERMTSASLLDTSAALKRTVST